MSRAGTAAYRARERAGVKPLKLTVPREATVEFLERTGHLRPPPGAYAGYEYTWPEVEAAATSFWSRVVLADVEV